MKTVLITGGSRGIGRAMVEAFSASGYKVAFTYKNSREMAEELAKKTGALAIYADSSSEADIISAVSQAKEALGDIYCLVNNAGISSFSLFTELTLAQWRDMMSVNLDAPFLYSREVIPGMINSGVGRIINISSVWGITGASCEVHYSAAKAGLIGMTKALAKELGPSGITVNAIAPGLIDTDMNKHLSKDELDSFIDCVPLMRSGLTAEVAECALFLASERAGYITGDVMNVSGGAVI